MVAPSRFPPSSWRSRRGESDESCSVTRIGALGGVDLVEARFVTGASHPHTHPELEVGLIVRGVRGVRARGRSLDAGAGSVVVFNPGDVHFGEPLDPVGSSYRAFLISRGGMPELADAWFPEPVIQDPELYAGLLAAHRALEAGEPADPDLLAAPLKRLIERHAAPFPGGRSNPHREAVQRVRDYLEANYPRRIRLESLSAIAGLNVFQLIRAFRAVFGLSPYAYLEQIRVHRAAGLLRDGRSVSQVAYLTGFSDQSHLTRFFKRVVGVPPGRYRKTALSSAAR